MTEQHYTPTYEELEPRLWVSEAIKEYKLGEYESAQTAASIAMALSSILKP